MHRCCQTLHFNAVLLVSLPHPYQHDGYWKNSWGGWGRRRKQSLDTMRKHLVNSLHISACVGNTLCNFGNISFSSFLKSPGNIQEKNTVLINTCILCNFTGLPELTRMFSIHTGKSHTSKEFVFWSNTVTTTSLMLSTGSALEPRHTTQ